MLLSCRRGKARKGPFKLGAWRSVKSRAIQASPVILSLGHCLPAQPGLCSPSTKPALPDAFGGADWAMA